MPWLTLRLQHATEILLRPMWSWGWLGIAAFISGLAWVRDEFAAAPLQQALRAVTLLPHWNWESWALVWSAALLLVMFEGSFRHSRQLAEELAREQERSERRRQALSADWGDVPLQDVIDRIDPQALANATHKDIGQDLEDRLRTGTIKSWGRYKTGQTTGPLTPIDAKDWHYVQLQFFTLIDRDDPEPECASGRANIYTSAIFDLRFNRAQVEANWPIRLAPERKRPSQLDIGSERPR